MCNKMGNLPGSESFVQQLRATPFFSEVDDDVIRQLELVDLVEDLSLRTVTGRLARLLLEDAMDDALHRPRWYTQAEIAARLGTVPDVLQRALSSLADDGLIEVERSVIRIHDREALEAIAT